MKEGQNFDSCYSVLPRGKPSPQAYFFGLKKKRKERPGDEAIELLTP